MLAAVGLAALMLAAVVVQTAGAKPTRAAGAIPFSSCGTGAFAVNSVSLNPNPPTLSSPVTVSFQGALNQVLTTGGTYLVQARLGSMKIFSKSGSLDNVLARNGLTTPVPPGALTITTSHTLPGSVPPFVTVDFTFSATNGDGSLLACVQFAVSFDP
jgi:ML domain